MRPHDSTRGRWTTPDALGGDMANPQSLNRYAYVGNNPLSFTDPLGLINTLVCSGVVGGETDCLTTDYGGADTGDAAGLAPLPPGSCADVYVDGAYEGNTCGGRILIPSIPNIPNVASGNRPGRPPKPGNPQTLPQTSPSSPYACEQENLSAVNNQFGTGLNTADVGTPPNYGPFQYSNGQPGVGTWNFDIFVPSQYQSNGISPGRYPINWWTYIVGVGPTLHIPGGPGGMDSGLTLYFSDSQFTSHIDSGFAYNPFGLLWHFLRDVLGIGGHPTCG